MPVMWTLIDILSHPFRWLHYTFEDRTVSKREFHYDSVMSSVILDIASERALVQRFGAASRANGDPRDIYKSDKWVNDWLRGYDEGNAQHPFEIYREIFARDKAKWEARHR